VRQYLNFYETIQEARMRLQGTVVLYDSHPYMVYHISDHHSDGIFRIYLMPLVEDEEKDYNYPNVEKVRYSQGEHAVGPFIDKWLEDHPRCALLRKMMNSPLFNKFRPFPIGMVNVGAKTYYVERQPLRKSEQGLTAQSIEATQIAIREVVPNRESKSIKSARRSDAIDIYSDEFGKAILGRYPSAQECLTNLVKSDILNNAVGFHRNFAFVRGPVDTIFLAYKTEIVGVVPFHNFELLKIGAKHRFYYEAIEDLNLFGAITIYQ
jgi:hypothetical protein